MMIKIFFSNWQRDERAPYPRRLGLLCGLMLVFFIISAGDFPASIANYEASFGDETAISDGGNREVASFTLYLLRDDGQTSMEWDDLAEETLWIEAEEIDAGPLRQVDPITVQITAMNTGKQTLVSLVYDPADSVHRGSVPVTQIVSQPEGLTAAAVVYGGSAPDPFDYDVALEFMDRLGVPLQNRLGVAFSTGSLDGEAVDWVPPANLSFFRAAGYELIEVETTQVFSDKVWGFAKNQADVLLYIGHGKHQRNWIFLEGLEYEKDPTPFYIGQAWDKLNIVMLFGCSVLDIGDQNGWWLFNVDEHNSSPGKAWVDLGPEQWLGFQVAAPRVRTQYGYNMIYAWASLYAGNGEAERSWKIASDLYMPGELGMGAVANDTQTYFYWEQYDWCLFGIWPCWDAYTWRALPRALWEAEVESLEGVLGSPAEVHVYDSLGRHLGPDGAGGFEAQIPGSSTWLAPLAGAAGGEAQARRVSILGADLNHAYNLQLRGLGDGDFHFLLEIPDHAHGQLYHVAYLTVPVSSGAVFSTTLVPGADFDLALDADGDGVFEGELAATGVTTTLDLPAGVVGAWSFEDGTGDVAHDNSAYHNDGALAGGAAWASGYQGGGLAFDGAGAHLLVPSSPSLNLLTDTLTLEAWVYPNDVQGEQVLLSRWGSGDEQRSYELALSDGHLHAALSPDGGTVVDLGASEGVVLPGVWSHVALASDGQSAWYFINGVYEQTAIAPPTTVYTGASPLYLGLSTASAAPRGFAGTLDEVKVYRGARGDYAPLAQSDWQGGPAQALWNGGNPARYASASSGIDDSVIGQLRLSGAALGDTVIYSPTGVLTSSIFDAGRPVAWTELSWTTWLTADAALQVAVSFSDDGLSWSDWITLTGAYAIGLNRHTLPRTSVAQMGRYRVTLRASSDRTQTPVLYDLALRARERDYVQFLPIVVK